MALTASDMLKAIHRKDPRTLSQRFTPAQIQATYSRLYGNAGTPPAPTLPAPVEEPAAPTETPEQAFQRRKEEMNRTIGAGTELGQQLIDRLGLGGQFLSRVDENPSADFTSDLSALRERTARAGELSALDLEALESARGALLGLDAPEMAALRSQATHNIDQQFGLQQQQLLRYQGGMGSAMQRAAQVADLAGKRVDAQRSLARDLLVENIQQKKDARLAFANLTNAVGARTDARTQALSGMLLSGNEFANSLKQSAQQFNNQTAAQEIASRTGALMGGIGATTSLMGGYKAEEFQNQALQEALKAKAQEIEATKELSRQALEAQKEIMNRISGRL